MQFGITDASPVSTRQSFARNFGGTSQSLESVVAVSRYEDGQLAEVRLYPTELGVDRPDSRLGIPRIAPPEIGRRIPERLQRLSRELGTTIDIEFVTAAGRANGIGFAKDNRGNVFRLLF